MVHSSLFDYEPDHQCFENADLGLYLGPPEAPPEHTKMMIARVLLCFLGTSSALRVQQNTPLLKLRGGALDTKTVNTLGAVYHGMFGLTLMSDPNFYSPSGASPIKYFEADAEGPVGEFAFRGFGIMMSAMGLAGIAEPESTALTKLYAIATALFTPHMVGTYKGNKMGNKKVWLMQIPMHLLVTALSVKKAFFD